MVNILKKILIITTTLIIIFNISFPIVGYATADDVGAGIAQVMTGPLTGLFNVLDGIVGILIWIPKAMTAATLYATQASVTQVAGIGGGAVLTPEDIIFTGSETREKNVGSSADIVNVNFFDLEGNGADDSLVYQFRSGIAKWYNVLRNIAISLSLAVCIYIGIRMVISTLASDKAKYKEMFKNWLVGFIILFFLHYFMIIILNLNNELVDLLYNVQAADNTSVFNDYNTGLLENVFTTIGFTESILALIMYIMLIGVTIALLIMYMKRLLTVGFLIVISPLVTVTYAIDKLGDGKSQALNTWMKEFCYSILIQPFHCIIYIVFISSTLSMTGGAFTPIKNMIFAMLSMLFIFKAEGIVKKIFGFEEVQSIGDAAAAGALFGSAMSNLASGAKSASGSKSSGQLGGSGTAGVKRKQIPNTTTNNDKNKQKTNNVTVANSNNSTSNVTRTTTNNNTQPQSSNQDKRSAAARAAADVKNDAKNNAREFKADPAGTFGRAMGQLGMRVLAALPKAALKITAGAMVAGGTGDLSKGFITGMAMPTGRYTRKVSDKATDRANEIQANSQAKKLATAYDAYRLANADLSDDELYNKSIDLLEADIDRLTDKNEIGLAHQLQKMRDTYATLGEKNPEKAVMKKVEDIQMGKIKNSLSISLDKVGSAAQNFKQLNQGMNNDQVQTLTRDIMMQIDEAKMNNQKYLESSNFKNLGQDEKKLAKEIYKSKDVLEAIGEVPSDVVNNEIDNAVTKGLGSGN